MKFFETKDFYGVHLDSTSDYFIPLSKAVEMANAKLEREGKIVYSYHPNEGHFVPNWIADKSMFHKEKVTHKAFLINIELIEKCTHSVGAYQMGNADPWKYINEDGAFFCSKCGINLKVKEWEEA
jgi:hypothetical protein